MELIDTHCHIQFDDNDGTSVSEILSSAKEAGVTRLICIGCTLQDSIAAIDMAENNSGVFATVGLHPHEASKYINDKPSLEKVAKIVTEPGVVAIGECGLDYFYNNSPAEDQKKLLRYQLDLAAKSNLPVVFHVRSAFDDFWTIYDEYVPKIKGVIHSFSSTKADLHAILDRELLVGLNGIVTFTKKNEQLDAVKSIPLNSLVLETDAPYLTPVPFRGTINQPKHVRRVAEFLSGLRGESLEELALATTKNALKLFGIE
ncbi:MAG TPA: TatD family hydrolase [Candidatus Saccharimonadales bacterium]|nr:TatD family hydrolase [Candidatus Saccharimonadales bacterium]